MRSVATFKNSIWGILQQAIICVLSIFSRKVMIETIGQQGVGLNALLTSIISLLSLAELGIGTAIVYHMYAPIAQNDKKRIAGLMHCYKIVYRLIAVAIMLIGLSILPFMGKIVNDVSYSHSYISLIFILFLLQTTSSYFFTYKRSLLSADQKQYVITVFDLLYKLVTIIGGIIILKITKELAYYLIFLIICTVLNNILISRYVDKAYPYINELNEKLPKKDIRSIFGDVKNIFISKVSGVVTTSTDSILINTFIGTIQTGLFSNYNIIINTLSSVTKQLSVGMKGSVGNLIAVEKPEHINVVVKRLIFIMFLLASFFASCLTGLIDRFIELVFGSGMLIERTNVYIMVLNIYIVTMEIPISCIIPASGLFKYDKYISITGTIVNLIISFVCGKMYGMAGILAGTTATYLMQFSLRLVIFYSKYLNRSCVKIFMRICVFSLAAFTECALVEWICQYVNIGNAYLTFLLCGVISALLPIAANILIFFKTDEFKYTIGMVKELVGLHNKNRADKYQKI